jgi:hypothetical protein
MNNLRFAFLAAAFFSVGAFAKGREASSLTGCFQGLVTHAANPGGFRLVEVTYETVGQSAKEQQGFNLTFRTDNGSTGKALVTVKVVEVLQNNGVDRQTKYECFLDYKAKAANENVFEMFDADLKFLTSRTGSK